MNATQMLRQQHRQLEQGLAIIEEHAEDFASELTPLVVDLTAHLTAEADVFYSAAEKVLGQPLADQRRHHGRVRQAAAQALTAGGGDAKTLTRLLFDLSEAFKAHVRAEELAVYPSLEGIMDGRQLEALGNEMATCHSTVAAAFRRPAERA